MSQHTAQTSGQSRIARMGVLILACGAACALTACSSSTSFQAGSTTENGQSAQATTAPSFASTASQGRFVGLYGTVDDTTWSTEGSDGQASMMQVSFATEGADFDPEVDPSGEFLVYASTQHAAYADIYRKKVDGNTVVRLTADPAEDVMPTVSPDGKWIAFSSNRSGNWDIWMMPFTGGPATQVTFEADHELHPSFSPDGTQLTYCRKNARSDRWEIWSFDLNSPGVRTYVCDGLFPQWCPDSNQKTILFQRARERGSQYFGIWTVDFKNGTCMNPTEIVAASDVAIMHPSWSPNGQLVCYCTVPQAENSEFWPAEADVWMIGIDGTGKAPLTTGSFRNMQPTWSNNGRIYFVSDRGGSDVIWAVPAAAPGQAATFTVAEPTDGSN